MNTIIISGNLVRDVELRYTQSGKAVGSFTVAVKRAYGEETDFINVVAWGITGENCEKYIGKGSKVSVEGELNIRNYENKEGQKRYVTEIKARKVEFHTWKSDKQNSTRAQQEDFMDDFQPIEEDDDDLPF